MAQILPRIDVLQGARRDPDLKQIELLDQAMDREIPEAGLALDRGPKRGCAGDEGEVLPTPCCIDGDSAVGALGFQQRTDGLGDERVIARQHDDPLGGHVGQRSADSGRGTRQWGVLPDHHGVADQPPQAVVPHDDDVRRVGHRSERPRQQRLALNDHRVLRYSSQAASSSAGEHDRIEVAHADQTRVSAMSGPDAEPPAVEPGWRTEPVSFTRRGGRLTERQQAAWDTVAATHVIDIPRHGPSTSVDPSFRLDTTGAFGRAAPLIVEIGSGRGEALVAAAKAQPEVNFLGLEVYIPGVAQTLVTMRHEGVTNVRMAVVNAPEALATMFRPGSVREVRTWFPDPWHKARHHKRRLITVEFTQLVARVLETAGLWRIATDWQDYADWITEVLATSPFVEGGPVPRFEGRPETRFERKGLSAGRAIHDFEARLRQTRPR